MQSFYSMILILKRWLIYNYSVLSLDRMACGYAYYAISFGVEQLSGSIYLNMFLLSIVEIPATLLTWWLNNWYTYILSFFKLIILLKPNTTHYLYINKVWRQHHIVHIRLFFLRKSRDSHFVSDFRLINT